MLERVESVRALVGNLDDFISNQPSYRALVETNERLRTHCRRLIEEKQTLGGRIRQLEEQVRLLRASELKAWCRNVLAQSAAKGTLIGTTRAAAAQDAPRD